MAHRIKVTNISRHVDQAIMTTLFTHIGEIASITMYPSSVKTDVQEAQIEFHDAASVRPALFLTGTEVADRALVVGEDLGVISGGVGGGTHAMPLANAAVVAMMAGRPRALNAIPPAVAAIIHPSVLQFDPVKAEEISRTIYVGNIASWVGEQQLMDFFSTSGPVAYVKMAGDGMQPTRFAFVEFADVRNAQAALQMNGMMLADRPLKVNHSKNAINKPQGRPTVVGGSAAGVVHHQQVVPFGGKMTAIPTLAAIASLPSNVDPLAAVGGGPLSNSSTMTQTTTPRQMGSSGLAWPVLGTINPIAPTISDASSSEQQLARKIRDLQAQMEEKYGTRKIYRSRSRESSKRRSSQRDDEDVRHSRRRRRSPSRERSRRRRDDSPHHRRHYDEYGRDSGRAASPWRR